MKKNKLIKKSESKCTLSVFFNVIKPLFPPATKNRWRLALSKTNVWTREREKEGEGEERLRVGEKEREREREREK